MVTSSSTVPRETRCSLQIKSSAHGEISMTAPYKGKFQYCFINNDNVNTKDVTFNIHGVVYVDGDDENAKTFGWLC